MTLYLDNKNHWTDSSRALTDEERKQIMLDAHPVDSYYFSANSTSPAILFGGQWEQIYGRFLYCSEQGQGSGQTGGSKTVTLTVDTMPSHTHSGGSHTHTGSCSSHTHSLGGHSHSLNSHTHSISHTHSVSHSHPMSHSHGFSNMFPGGSPIGVNLSRYSTKVNSGFAGGNLFSSFGTTPSGVTDDYTGNTGTVSPTTSDSSSSNTGAASGSTGTASGNTGSASPGITVNSASVSVDSAGGGKAHDNMPPYLTVYCWRRTA